MRTPIRIDQALQSYYSKDAIGNHVFMTNMLLKERGFDSHIYAKDWQQDLECTDFDRYPRYDHHDQILIYQFSIGSRISLDLHRTKAFKVTSYHNITPPDYFSDPSEWEAFLSTKQGISQIPLVKSCTDVTWTVSNYNASELAAYGFDDPQVFPVLRDYARLTKEEPDTALLQALCQNRNNLLYVGRIVPHKGIHDLVALTFLIKKHIKPKIRLILAGGYSEGYYRRICDLARQLNLTIGFLQDSRWVDYDILLTGSISDQQLATVYRAADVFSTMSDHEGFCVPLVEAMFFDLPIIANDTGGIPETCGDAGIILSKSDKKALISCFQEIFEQPSAADYLKEKMHQRKSDFTMDALVQKFDQCLEYTLKKYVDRRRKG